MLDQEFCELDTPALRRIARRLADHSTPAPCDRCPNSPCGSACAAFAAYVDGRPWQHAAREPSERLLESLLRD